MDKEKIYIVIPAYNEAIVLGKVIDEIKKNGFNNIVVVDDGSIDNTSLVLKDKEIINVRHSLNRGKGASIKTGFEACKLLGADIIITFDGDGQHDPIDIKSMIQLIQKGYDVVMGCRNYKEKHMPRYKVVGNSIGNFITWLIYGLWVSDSQFGLRAYSRKAIDNIHLTSDRYEFDSEIIREIARHGLKHCEMTAHVRYTEYARKKKNKQSVISAIKMVFRMLLTG